MTRTSIFRRLSAAHWLAFAMLLAACDSSDPFSGCGDQCTHPWNGTPGSCANNGTFGANGGPCDYVVLEGEVCSDPQATCVDHVCVPCGSTDEACCVNGIGNAAPTSCNGGETCTSGTDFSTCQACGNTGEKCCGGGGPQCQEGICDLDSNTCEVAIGGGGSGSGSGSGAPNPCTGTSQYWVVGLDNAGCVQGIQSFMSSNAMEAQACATLYQAQNGWPKISAVGATTQDETICETSFSIWGSQVSYKVVDSSAATSCAMELCAPDPGDPKYGCTYTTGMCPLP